MSATTSFTPAHPLGVLAKPLLVFLCALLLGGLAPLRAGAEEKEGPYRLRPGDEIAITVSPQKAYECSGTILPDGTVTLRNIGAVKAEGLTLDQLAQKAREALSAKLVNPRVNAVVLRLAPQTAAEKAPVPRVTLVGAISKPGPLELEKGLRVRRALELAGGPTDKADLSRVSIIHRDLTRTVVDLSTEEKVLDPLHNRELKEGDSVEVPVAAVRSVTVLGAVARPGPLPLVEGLRLRAALDLVGGQSGDADVARIRIRHKDFTQTDADLSNPELLKDPERNPLLADGDVVEVPSVRSTARDGFIRVVGQVANPGQYPYRAGMALDDLIVMAGKLTPTADYRNVVLRREGQPEQKVDLATQIERGLEGKVPLEIGDEVLVPEVKDSVIVVGAVPKPGPTAVKPGQTLEEFFLEGGADRAALLDPSRVDLKNIEVLRRGEDPVKVDMASLLRNKKRKKDKQVVLKNGDIIFIPPYQPKARRSGLDFLNYLGPIGWLFGGVGI